MKEDEVISGASTARAGERLQDYERLKLQLGGLSQRVLRLIDSQADPERHRRCRDLLAALAEDRFTIAASGNWSAVRGCSRSDTPSSCCEVE
jgi:hypothetical protein